MAKLIQQQIDSNLLQACEPIQQMAPCDVARKAEEIRSKMQVALRDELEESISRDQLVLEGKTEESKLRTEPLAIKVARTDELMALLYELLLQRVTSTFIDLHFFQVVEAEIALNLYLQHILSLRRYCSEEEVVTIVTGRGLHSKNGVAKLRPAVENLLIQQKISYRGDVGSFRI
ncbi:Hypothetical predicted protein [Cloeon dipterum]|nr:Hypothetical predicted protein [Cloeon dipterum]